MKIIKVSTELEMSVHEFPEGTMREQNTLASINGERRFLCENWWIG